MISRTEVRSRTGVVADMGQPRTESSSVRLGGSGVEIASPYPAKSTIPN
jgi:hypothetical protein